VQVSTYRQGDFTGVKPGIIDALMPKNSLEIPVSGRSGALMMGRLNGKPMKIGPRRGEWGCGGGPHLQGEVLVRWARRRQTIGDPLLLITCLQRSVLPRFNVQQRDVLVLLDHSLQFTTLIIREHRPSVEYQHVATRDLAVTLLEHLEIDLHVLHELATWLALQELYLNGG